MKSIKAFHSVELKLQLVSVEKEGEGEGRRMVAILVIKEAGKLNSPTNLLTEIFRQWKKNAFRQIFYKLCKLNIHKILRVILQKNRRF